jgi:hypothetical protein
MTRSPPIVLKPITGTCPFCGFKYMGSPAHCSKCGTIQESARGAIREEGKGARRHLRFQRAYSDLFFLIGLLLGGPMMSLGGEIRLGLILVLAGAFSSVLRRYTEWSTPGTVGIGILTAALVATAAIDATPEPEEDGAAREAVREEVRLAYVQALGEQDLDVLVEPRGLGAVTIWFHPPQVMAVECGSYPAPRIRAHLAELGFRRVVVVTRNQKGGMCSFRP